MWDERYADESYAYGTEPNVFLKEALGQYPIKGSMLFPAEGEGRNAVYAAKQGLAVTAFDMSIEGKKKALRLAEQAEVSINYEVGNLFELPLIKKQYDAAALIYAHFPPPILSKYHQKIGELIKPEGMIIFEGFSKGHLPLREANPKVGGPNKLEMLFSTNSIQNDFPDFEIILLEEVEIDLAEGLYHNGRGKVIRFVGKKKAH
ncbi:MAG: class I SAM-dependent methyltransferase [Bacteroidota bacterium]